MPDKIEEDVSEELDEIRYHLMGLSELVAVISEVRDDIRRFEENRSMAISTEEEAENILSNDVEEIPEERLEEARADLERAQDYIDRVEPKINNLKEREEEVLEELDNEISSFRTQSQNLRRRIAT